MTDWPTILDRWSKGDPDLVGAGADCIHRWLTHPIENSYRTLTMVYCPGDATRYDLVITRLDEPADAYVEAARGDVAWLGSTRPGPHVIAVSVVNMGLAGVFVLDQGPIDPEYLNNAIGNRSGRIAGGSILAIAGLLNHTIARLEGAPL